MAEPAKQPEDPIACPSCESVQDDMMCLQCGHSLCATCLGLFQAQTKYFRCPICRVYIVQKPYENLLCNRLIRLWREQTLQKKAKLTQQNTRVPTQGPPDRIVCSATVRLQENFRPVQLECDGCLIIIQNSHTKYPEFVSFKFLSDSPELSVQIQIESPIKQYCVEKQLDFREQKSLCLPVGPRSKLFASSPSTGQPGLPATSIAAEREKETEFRISISRIPLRLGLIADALDDSVAEIEAKLTPEECLIILQAVLQKKSNPAPLNQSRGFQAALIKCQGLLQTADWGLVGQKLDFTALARIVKEQKTKYFAEQPQHQLGTDQACQVDPPLDSQRKKALGEIAALQTHVRLKETEILSLTQALKREAAAKIAALEGKAKVQCFFNEVQQQNQQLLQKLLVVQRFLTQDFDIASTPILTAKQFRPLEAASIVLKRATINNSARQESITLTPQDLIGIRQIAVTTKNKRTFSIDVNAAFGKKECQALLEGLSQNANVVFLK